MNWGDSKLTQRIKPPNLMQFLAIESLRISLELNISVAGEQQAVGLGPLMQLDHG